MPGIASEIRDLLLNTWRNERQSCHVFQSAYFLVRLSGSGLRQVPVITRQIGISTTAPYAHVSSALNCEANVGHVELIPGGVHAINVGFLENFVNVAT